MKDSSTNATVPIVPSDAMHSLPERAGESDSVSQVLNVLASDIDSYPENLKLVDTRLVSRINSLVLGVCVDLEATLLTADD
ncbi:type II toxin-antitoxin system PrlF family antitoxin [Pseudomonas sp. Irchel s3b2]|uniref:type II toxin-antitoxin system PrlF family antitoxin n=1 Tax=Pseudomonas sp. Irchel s3b2 TaxID=2009073 RepID=UPI000BA4D54B|nr:type II toxin-antitoxin system PrlF family antitoxin [Pseudomonas sp. Irchel s3b2]